MTEAASLPGERPSSLVAFVSSTDLDRSRAFYVGVLGLTEVETNPFALVLRSGDTLLRVTKVETLTPQPFTVLGWWVPDVRTVPIEPIRYDGMGQDPDGVWTAPGGAQIRWFHDPDLNVLSVTQD